MPVKQNIKLPSPKTEKITAHLNRDSIELVNSGVTYQPGTLGT